ncbi:Cell division protein FtsQ [Streptomyces sp. RB5]|uniref:Cell division protein FtsQ n=1 Tax=Streptomyces smaragdinus TaxID=2585196 RepID=A0A7K0CTK4_9ACTN|nr:FtsQ-type POTRA domain-containing protein [Streptomyces smaragdinus]MQY16816.1 Cell division protein FtsQ [Streptomyces smaragdinus]
MGSAAGPATARRDDEARPRPPAPRPARRRPDLRLVLAAAVLVAVLGGFAVWVLYGSPWLRVENVRASGADVLTDAEVLAAAGVPRDVPLVSVDTGAVEARVRQRLPRVDSVTVTRSWPHGIRVSVTEREPAVLMKEKGRYVEVDAGGVRFATVAAAPAGVPVLRLDAQNSPSLERFGLGALRRAAVTVAGDLPAAVRHETQTIEVGSYDSITLELRDGRTVMWGSAEDGAAKARVLTALFGAAKDADHFDVSAPEAPAVS